MIRKGISMEIPVGLIVGGGVVFLAALLVLVFMSRKARAIDLDRSEGGLDKPEWVQTTVPHETVSELRSDGDAYRMFDQDPGEEVAAPFAEQIEDIIHVLMKKNPDLASIDLDLGSAEDGSLEIWIDGELHTSVDEISDARIQEIFRSAIARWEAGT